MNVHINATGKTAFAGVRSKWMVVDDTKNVLQMTAEMLAMLTDAEICCFQSAKEALRVFESDPSAFGLVVTDFDMPEMNGAELCCQLRAIAPALKIILTTGSVNISEAKAFHLGFAAFLAKPFSMAAISSALIRAQASGLRIFNSASSRSLRACFKNSGAGILPAAGASSPSFIAGRMPAMAGWKPAPLFFKHALKVTARKLCA